MGSTVNERPLNILILGVQVPFTRGGAEVLLERLRNALVERGHCVDIVALPFSAQPKSAVLKQVALWRGLDLQEYAGRTVDVVIGTKFPSYCVQHPCKLVWLIHQHRQLYELYGSRFGDFDTGPVDESIRQLVYQADRIALSECVGRFTISNNVSSRLASYLNLDSVALEPPLPLADQYRRGKTGDYILSVGRLCSIKRVDLVVRALPQIDDRLRLKIVGSADEPAIESYLRSELDKHHLWHRVEFLGRVSDDQLLSLYADAFAVFYAPYDEDFGFVALEALCSGKPVVTAKDSGTVLEFVEHERNGIVTEPEPDAIAKAFNRLVNDSSLYERLGSASVPRQNSWNEVLNQLLAAV